MILGLVIAMTKLEVKIFKLQLFVDSGKYKCLSKQRQAVVYWNLVRLKNKLIRREEKHQLRYNMAKIAVESAVETIKRGYLSSNQKLDLVTMFIEGVRKSKL